MHGLGSFNHWNRRLSVSVFRCSTFWWSKSCEGLIH
jgi:hypothetical protein